MIGTKIYAGFFMASSLIVIIFSAQDEVRFGPVACNRNLEAFCFFFKFCGCPKKEIYKKPKK